VTHAGGEAWRPGSDLTAEAAPPLTPDFVYGPIEESTTPVGLPASLFLLAIVAYGIARYSRLPQETPLRERLLLAAALLGILFVKIAIARNFQYKIDVTAYGAWALKLAEEGPARFYAPGYFADYPPGYMYVLWWIGLASKVMHVAWGTPGFIVLLKLPALLADLAIAHLLFARLRGYGARLAWFACLAFALNPALVLDSAV